MTKRLNQCAILLMTAALLSAGFAQAQTRSSKKHEVNNTTVSPVGLKFSDLLAQARHARRAGFALMPSRNSGNASSPVFSFNLMAGPNLPVVGSGTVGRLTKWTAVTSSNSFIGNSTIFEDKNGLVGIGTDTPTSRLTVAGVIESIIGGFKFPDGTIQTTSASGALFEVVHDATLTGNGTAGSPLGVAVPLILNGSIESNSILRATNTADSGRGIDARGSLGGEGIRANGGNSATAGGAGVVAFGGVSFGSSSSFGGVGVRGIGGISDLGRGGIGVTANGGLSDSGDGGTGTIAIGGNSNSGFGGTGVSANGGKSRDILGGTGVLADGGDSDSGNGGIGVRAFGGNGIGANNSGGIGIEATGGDGDGGATQGLAAKFNGDVEVTGNLSKGGGSFKIDHPLDPGNKYLYHSFVESPDMKNIYDGNVVTDENGEATVTLPNYFEALNRDFCYQLTVLGTFAQAIVAEKIKGNRFVIRTNSPNVEVSWQVTGTRQDPWAKKNRIQVEVEKTNGERGFYLHPEAFDQPDERGIEWAQNPALMQQRRQQRIDSKQKPNRK